MTSNELIDISVDIGAALLENGAEIYRTKTGFHYPLSRDRAGNYKVKSGEQLRVCMTSDFFLEDANPCTLTWWTTGAIPSRRKSCMCHTSALTAPLAAADLSATAAAIAANTCDRTALL